MIDKSQSIKVLILPENKVQEIKLKVLTCNNWKCNYQNIKYQFDLTKKDTKTTTTTLFAKCINSTGH